MTSALEIHRKKHYVAAKMATETIGLSLFSQSFVDKQLQTLTCYTSVYKVLNYMFSEDRQQIVFAQDI